MIGGDGSGRPASAVSCPTSVGTGLGGLARDPRGARSSRVTYAGRAERRYATTAGSLFSQGRSVFQLERCSGRWKSPLATAGRPALATQPKTSRRLNSSYRSISPPRSCHSRQKRRVVRSGCARAGRCGGARRRWRLHVLEPAHRLGQSVLDGHEVTQSDCQRVTGTSGLRIVVGQLEPGNDEETVEHAGALGFSPNRLHVVGVVPFVDPVSCPDSRAATDRPSEGRGR